MKKINVLSLFDGMSCGYQALKEAGISVGKYYASEIDNHAITISKKNHPDIVHVGDIRDLDRRDFKEVDLIIGGSPCQDLSSLPNKQGSRGLLGDKSKLFYEYIRLKEGIGPKWFLLENVKPAKKAWWDIMDNLLDVKGQLINSDLFVGQSRPRVYWTNIPIKKLPARPNWNGKYWISGYGKMRKQLKGVSPCLTTMGIYTIYKSKLKKPENRITIEEMEELQGLPVGYTEGVSKTARSKMIGNGWTVPVISHIFSGLK